MAQLQESTYTERLNVPWWFWPVGIVFAAVASAEIFLGANPLVNWIPYAILIPLTIIGLVRLGGITIRVDAAIRADAATSGPVEFRVDDAHIPVSYITEVNVLDYAAKTELLGPAAAPHVFVIQRPWVRQAVRVVIDDPADPTPYWVISSRRPDVLAEAIRTARADVTV